MGRKTKGRGTGRPATGPAAIAQAHRRAQALAMRSGGATLQEIADRLGYAGPSGAWKAIQAGMRAIQVDGVEDLRRLEAHRLDELQLAVWVRAQRGDLKAIDQVLRIMMRRASLLGLDRASRVDITSQGERVVFACDPGFGDWEPPDRTPDEADAITALHAAVQERLAAAAE